MQGVNLVDSGDIYPISTTVPAALDHAATALKQAQRRIGKCKKPDELREVASVEFTRLFRGVKPRYSPPLPYESVYRDEGGRVFGESASTVRQEYRRFGFDLVNELSGEPPDHISFGLEFIHLLCRQEVEAREKDDEDETLRFVKSQKDFLEEHLLTWLRRFCDNIKEYDRLGLFSGLADLTEGWVNFDYEQHLQEVVSFSPVAEITDGYSATEND